jgi:hypothetical protein
MVEQGKGLPWFHWMKLLKCLEPMHTLFKHIFLHVQVPSCNAIVPMEVEKYLKPFAKISKKVELGL